MAPVGPFHAAACTELRIVGIEWDSCLRKENFFLKRKLLSSVPTFLLWKISSLQKSCNNSKHSYTHHLDLPNSTILPVCFIFLCTNVFFCWTIWSKYPGGHNPIETSMQDCVVTCCLYSSFTLASNILRKYIRINTMLKLTLFNQNVFSYDSRAMKWIYTLLPQFLSIIASVS